MRRLLIAALSLALFGPALAAQDKDKTKAEKPAGPAAAEHKALMGELDKLYNDTREALGGAKNDMEKRQQIITDYRKKAQGFAGRFLDLAQKHSKDPAAVDALLMVLNLGGEAEQEKALVMLQSDHLQSEKLGQACERLAMSPSPGAEKLIRTVLEKSPHKAAQAQAAYSLAQQLKQRAEEPGATLENSQKLNKEAEDLLDRVVKQFPDAKGGRGQPLAAMAEKELFAIRNLAIGREAPEITGDDGDSKKFKLSDYRGKVVVLDFWASWCGPCMAMVPHEREMVKRLEGKPFALIGVNLDSTRDLLKKTEEQHKMTWRSFFDGAQGPISDKWNIQSIPSIYVLDHKGVIRYKDVRDKDLEKAVETLLKDVPAEKK